MSVMPVENRSKGSTSSVQDEDKGPKRSLREKALKEEAKSIRHMLTHIPKNPYTAPCLFLASFIFVRKFIFSVSDSAYLVSVFSMLISPIFFPIVPEASFKVLNFSAYFPGGPNSVSQNHINFRCQKRTQN